MLSNRRNNTLQVQKLGIDEETSCKKNPTLLKLKEARTRQNKLMLLFLGISERHASWVEDVEGCE